MKKKLILISVIVFSAIVLVWCWDKNKVAFGNMACIVYTWTFVDWTIFDTSSSSGTVCFIVWSWKMIKWLEKWVIGMKIWNKKNITILPQDWFGDEYNNANVQKISKFIFDKLKIDIQDWKMQKIWNIEWVVKWTEKDENWNDVVLFDINPRKTWDKIIYKVFLVNLEKDPSSFVSSSFGNKPRNLVNSY